jgi:hypothetical protein
MALGCDVVQHHRSEESSYRQYVAPQVVEEVTSVSLDLIRMSFRTIGVEMFPLDLLIFKTFTYCSG